MPDRLPVLRPEELSDAQRELYGEIVGGRRGSGSKPFELTDSHGGLVGPFNAMLYSPTVGRALQALGSAVRFGSALSPRARELAILAVANSWSSEFELYAHEAIGRSVGLSDTELVALRRGESPDLESEEELAVLVVVDALVHRADLDDAEFTEAVTRLGSQVLFELSTLVGYYSTLALQLRVFRVISPAAGEEKT